MPTRHDAFGQDHARRQEPRRGKLRNGETPALQGRGPGEKGVAVSTAQRIEACP